MTERKRATKVRETTFSQRVSYPDLCVGAERYQQDMTRFPILSYEQTLAAVFAFQSGSSVDRLRSHTLFAPHLQAEEKRYYQDENYRFQRPTASFRELFAESPNIDFLVAFGRFDLVQKWGEKYTRAYASLTLPIEKYYSDALYWVIPNMVGRYVPVEDATFDMYVSIGLKRLLEKVVEKEITVSRPLPPGVNTQPGLPAKRDKRRNSLLSLDNLADLNDGNNTDEANAFSELKEDPEANEHVDSRATYAAIEYLYSLAGLPESQWETVTALLINDEKQVNVARRLELTVRAVRSRRDVSLPKLRALGEETVKSILTGEEIDQEIETPQ
jgi:hypothetical protein